MSASSLFTVPGTYTAAPPLNSAKRWSVADWITVLRCSSDCPLFSPSRAAAPMSYMLTVAMALMRGSILAALITKLPLPQIPRPPIRSGST
ncbi:hypothetical protein D9M71_720320 [compost metagenome]